jgi:ketosteroid isomerase-like protein
MSDDREADIVVAAYAAFARADIEAAIAHLDPDVEWIEPDDFPDGGRHLGREAVRRYLQRSRDGWSELRSTPTVHRRGERLVFEHRVDGVLQDGRPRQAAVADVFTFRDGLVVHMRAYPSLSDVPD